MLLFFNSFTAHGIRDLSIRRTRQMVIRGRSQSSVDVGVVMFVRSDDGDGCDECDGDDSLMVWTTEPAGGRLPVVGATGKAQGGGAAVTWDAGDIGPSESDSVSPDPTPGSSKRAKTMRARFRCRGIRH